MIDRPDSPLPPSGRALAVPLVLEPVNESAGRRCEPIRQGIPLPRGAWNGRGSVVLDYRGTRSATQARALDRWVDGSVRWALIDAQVEPPSQSESATLLFGATEADPGGSLAEARGEDVLVDTGRARFHLSPGGPFPLQSVLVDGRNLLDASATGFLAIDERGSRPSFRTDRLAIEENGPWRAVVVVEGDLELKPHGVWLRAISRLHFFRSLALVECHLTLRNPHRAKHPHGLWDLGDEGSTFIRDAALVLGLAAGDGPITSACSVEPGAPLEPVGVSLELYQDSSGGENWRSSNHINRRREVPVSFRRYRLRTETGETTGLRATPIVTLRAGTVAVGVAMRYFWQNFPKAIEVDGSRLSLRLFPGQYADVHEIQGGEQKTHRFAIAFGDDIGALVAHRDPIRVRATPEWYCQAGAFPHLTPRAFDSHTEYLALVDAAIEGPHSFEAKREAIDEYGWRHFGDLYGDHEAVRHQGPSPLISHYNNQYDVVAGLAAQFMRSGDWRWWWAMDEMAWHVLDIDLYHTDEDKSAYNHGQFWHTYHYVDADTANHRSYPARYAEEVKGGGPSVEMTYAAGLALHYFLTGNVLARDAAVQLAEYIMAIDDGTKTVFRWLDRGDTGYASASGMLAYQGPGRGPANAISVLLDGHRLTGERRFLHKAEQLIRRCIHPADDVAARNLLDAERRWYYNMFLQSVGKYLDWKIALDELDGRYAYARESLVHYARWMADHEYPYLDRPEILEYPTETWAAQDMRKSEVFGYAAKHSTGLERERFLERAEFFFRYSTTKLASMPTRTLARPVVLLLANGLLRSFWRLHPDASAPPPRSTPHDFGQPVVFIPQRIRAKRRAVALAGIGGALAVAATLVLVFRLIGG
jgi:YetA-like protein